jgi:site-specific recombinase XerD
MAIEAKVSLISLLEKRMADTLTVQQMEKLTGAAADILDGFDVQEIAREDDGPDDLLQIYVSALKVEGRSQKTIDRYIYVIGRMLAFAKVPTRRVTVYHLRAYLAQEKERGIADQTLEGCREVFSAFFNWLQREDLIEKNPTANLGAIKCPKKEKKTYSEIDLEKLNQCCKTIRDRAILHFLGATGCRVSEMTGLDRENVDIVKLECVVHGKGNKERTVYLDPVSGMLLKQYLDRRKDGEKPLFLSKRGKRLKPGGVRAMLRKLADDAGVDHVHPHKFRRTLATDLTRHGMPIQEVAAILGHEKLDTTMKYVVLNKDDIRNSYRRFT